MTVSSSYAPNVSTGNGVTTVFPYNFRVLAAADMEVSVDGVVKTNPTDYTLSGIGAGSGGNVTFTVAPPNGAQVIRRRNMALARTTDYQDNGDLLADVLNPDQDAPVMMAQQLQEQIDRSIKAPLGESAAALTLPTAAARANKTPVFDASGNLTVAATPANAQLAVDQATAQAGIATAQAVVATTQAGVAAVQAGAAGVSAGQASAYAAAAATGAKFYDTIALGRAAVADTFTFGVKAGGSDGLTRPTLYRRDSSSTQTQIVPLVTGTEFDTETARVDTMVGAKYETIGRSGTPVTGSNDADNTTVLLKPISRDGSIRHVRAFLGTGATALHVKVFRPSASALVQVSDTSIAAAAGLNSFDADLGAFTAIPVLAGDVVGWYVTGGRMNFAGTGTDVYVNAAGNVTSFATGFNTGVTWAFGYDVQTTYHPTEVEYEGIDRRSQRLGSNLTQTIGRPSGATLVTGSAPPNATYVLDQAASEDGLITTVRMFSLGTGTFEVRTFDLSNGVFVGGSPLTLNVVPGLNTFSSANGDFTALRIKRGQRIGFYGGARLADISATSDSGGFYNGTGNATTGGSVFANGGLFSTLQFQVSFDITYFKTQAVKFSLITVAAYAALGTPDPDTLYAVI